MREARRLCLGALLLAGCARVVPYTREPRPCQADAAALVWREVYGRTDRLPDIWWVPTAAQTCGTPRPDGTRGYRGTEGTCLGGDAWSGGIDLVWYGSWVQTGLAHELAHVVQAREGQPPDFDHKSAAFQPGGAVALANARLAAADLCPPPAEKR